MIDQNTLWNERARTLGEKAGTQDRIAKRLEIEAIAQYVQDGMYVLDAGCGDGETMVALAQRYHIAIEGLDQSEEMIAHAQQRGLVATLSDIFAWTKSGYDLIYTERTIINLPSWETQRRAMQYLIGLLKPGGVYIACECCQEGLDHINTLRGALDLPAILSPAHNRYLVAREVTAAWQDGWLPMFTERDYSSTYYALSRVVNAAICVSAGREPQYDDPINELALHLPALIPGLGQGRIWAFRRPS